MPENPIRNFAARDQHVLIERRVVLKMQAVSDEDSGCLEEIENWKIG